MAKIHTVDWTPAIIAHPTTVVALRANWWGILGETFEKKFGRHTRNELIHGIPGSPKALHGVPYSLTEEFVAVYRMHPLIPDEFVFRAVSDDHVIQERSFPEIGALHVRECFAQVPLADALYSFGIANPGAITLHNYPRFLQRLERPDGEIVDLAATDIVRTRERGVPRYNEFRRLFHLKPVETFEELTDNPEWVEEIRRIYDGDIERVDLMIGLYAEPCPKGFGFSDTAFRVFILMASPAARGRPVLHRRLPARGVHAGRDRLGRVEQHALGTASPLPRAGAVAPGCRESVRALALGRLVTELAPGVHSLGHGKGGHVHAFLIDDGNELTLVDTLFEERRPARARGDRTASAGGRAT